ncbi:hypothetical protein SSS_04903 [Sarcoptes scabiei]|uniref:Uncharacterized protein n=1 Tax=Sarcoptes scabiei TaxID=52283 RepID=A0A834VBF8_SARSC|nr:hypothetical protein SSS_04903 [Sarcoptes scabiei]
MKHKRAQSIMIVPTLWFIVIWFLGGFWTRSMSMTDANRFDKAIANTKPSDNESTKQSIFLSNKLKIEQKQSSELSMKQESKTKDFFNVNHSIEDDEQIVDIFNIENNNDSQDDRGGGGDIGGIQIDSLWATDNGDGIINGIEENRNDPNKRLYSYDEIIEEIEKVTEEFYHEFISMRNMLPKIPTMAIINQNSRANSGNKNGDDGDSDGDGDSIMNQSINNSGKDDDGDGDGDDYIHQSRRRRRWIEDFNVDDDDAFVPDFIRDGIRFISKIEPIENVSSSLNPTKSIRLQSLNLVERICNQKGFVQDIFTLKFNHQNYLICLIKSFDRNDPNQLYHRSNQNGNNLNINYRIEFGSLDDPTQNGSFRIDLEHPKRLLAFVYSNLNQEQLILILINEKRTLDESNIKWYQISTENNVIYHNHFVQLKRVHSKNVAIWPKRNILIVHDHFETALKMYKFVGTYFDYVESLITITNDLNAICAFTLSGISYLALGYRDHHSHHYQYQNQNQHQNHRQTLKDVSVYRFNDYLERLELIQSIPTTDGIISIEYFIIGHGINQENFLAIIDRNNIVMYKFLKSKREFIVFQRITSGPIRRVLTYGDTQRLFTMTIILESNDLYFITYNSLRFIYSPINIRVFVNQQQPIYLKRILSTQTLIDSMIEKQNRQTNFNQSPPQIHNGDDDDDDYQNQHQHQQSIQLMIGSINGIRMYNIYFRTDNNLFKLWTEHLQWCRMKRTEMDSLERNVTIIQRRFHESYLKNDRIQIRGTLRVPKFITTKPIQTQSFRSQNLTIDREYFSSLDRMKKILDSIEMQIQQNHGLLSNAIVLNSPNLQIITGNLTFTELSILRFDGNERTDRNLFDHYYRHSFPSTFNLITDYLNGQMIRDLYVSVIRITSGDNNRPIYINQPIFFDNIHLHNHKNQLFVNGLVNERYNLSNLVTSNRNHFISGMKIFHQTLIVDEQIYCDDLNGRAFNSSTVLLTVGEQFVRNPIRIEADRIRAGRLKAITINGYNLDDFFDSIITIDQPQSVLMEKMASLEIQFTETLIVNDLIFDSGALLNGRNLEHIFQYSLWLNRPNQTIYGNCFFHNNNVTIQGGIDVQRINGKLIPNELIHFNQFNQIIGQKVFHDLVHVDRLIVTETLNGLMITNGVPDIIIDDIEQNITGIKIIQKNLIVEGDSSIKGRVNGLNLDEIDRRSRLETKTRYFDRIQIDNYARFEGGLWFKQINNLGEEQFEHLIENSLSLNDQWSNLGFDHIHFEHLHVNELDCDTINGIDIGRQLLTRNTFQTISEPIRFQSGIVLNNQTKIDVLNEISMASVFNENNVLLKSSRNQLVNGTKKIIGSIFVGSLITDSINNIPIDDVKKTITGIKHFNFVNRDRGTHLIIERARINDLIIESINNANVNHIINYSLDRWERQNISDQFRFNTLLIGSNEIFDCDSINSIDLRFLRDDIVYLDDRDQKDEERRQIVTGHKVFEGKVTFEDLEFNRLFDTVTDYELRHYWLNNQNESDRIRTLRANFSIDQLTVNNIEIDDSIVNGINLDSLVENLVWLDRKTVIQSPIHFRGNVKIDGNILLNGRLNGLDPRKDIVLRDHSGIQTIRGQIRFANDVVVRNDFDVNGRINDIDIQNLCRRAYRKDLKRKEPLIINGDVDFRDDIEFSTINEMSFDELSTKTIRRNIDDQRISGKKIIDHLVLDGPTTVMNLINDLDLRYVFQNYLSITKDQDVEANFVLKNVRFENDIFIDRIISESNLINGIDFEQIDRNSLRESGEQIYEGNIHFEQPIDIVWNLNVDWINGIRFENLLNKRRSINTFQDEIVFTENLNVKNSMNILRGKRISNIHFDRLYRDVITKNSDRNLTIYGEKIFDHIEMHILHTKPLNNVTISRENLLLKRFDQTVYGTTRFVKDLIINKTLIVDRINQIQINELRKRLVRKSSRNIIKTKVKVKSLIVKDARINSFIDNVNISILNEFAHRAWYLRDLDQRLSWIRKDFDLFRSNLQRIGSELIRFELIDHLLPKDLNRRSTLDEPILFSNILDDYICLAFVTDHNEMHCNRMEIVCNRIGFVTETLGSHRAWNHSFEIWFPGTIISLEQSNNLWFLTSDLREISSQNYQECVRKNSATERSFLINFETNLHNDYGNIWLQTIRWLTDEQGPFIQNSLHQHLFYSNETMILSAKSIQLILMLDLNPSFILIVNENGLDLYEIGQIHSIQFDRRQKLMIDGRIFFAYYFELKVFVGIFDPSSSVSYRIEIYRIDNLGSKLKRINSIQNIIPFRMSMIRIPETVSFSGFPFRNYLIVSESSQNYLKIFGSIDGSNYTLIQWIPIGSIRTFYTFNDHYGRPTLVVHECDQIRIFQSKGSQYFQQIFLIESNRSERLLVSASYLMILYRFDRNNQLSNKSRQDSSHPFESSIWSEVDRIEILTPKYRIDSRIFSNKNTLYIH